jgi:hypothetical protein
VRILLTPIAAQASDLIPREATDLSYLKGIGSGAALWDFDIPGPAADQMPAGNTGLGQSLHADAVMPLARQEDEPPADDQELAPAATSEIEALDQVRLPVVPLIEPEPAAAAESIDARIGDVAAIQSASRADFSLDTEQPSVPPLSELVSALQEADIAVAHVVPESEAGSATDVAAAPCAAPEADDPLAPINALSPEERIALFT